MHVIARKCVQFYKRTDGPLLLACLVCSAVSLFLLWGIYNTGYVKGRVLFTQSVAVLLGVVAACIISLFDYRVLARLWKLYVPVSVGLVMLTYFVGIQRYDYVDDKAWLELPFIGVTFQPSEILKLVFIFTFALHLEKVKEQINALPTLALLCLHGAVPVVMIMLQGDHGTAMVFVAIFVMMLFAAGLSFTYVGAAVLAAGVASPFAWFFLLDDDKRKRILTVFNPELDPEGASWQQINGITAIGSGQIWGKGVLTGSHQYVPEMHNDFIFAFLGESGGFMGCLGVVLLLALVCLLLLLAAQGARDALGRYICVGVFAIFFFQTLWSIGMCLSLLPVVGLTLPLLSAGGSSVVLTWAGVGMALSVYRYSHAGLFDGR